MRWDLVSCQPSVGYLSIDLLLIKLELYFELCTVSGSSSASDGKGEQLINLSHPPRWAAALNINQRCQITPKLRPSLPRIDLNLSLKKKLIDETYEIMQVDNSPRSK